MQKVYVMTEKNKIIDRPIYTDFIRPFIGKNIIKVITGQRRIGKSYILKKIAGMIAESDSQANIITINLEDFAFSHIKDAESLHQEIAHRLDNSKNNYIFLDEIQEVKDFDRVVRSLLLDDKIDIYITGSNSAMLSSEMASRLAGRSIEVRVHPLSYNEFLLFHNLSDTDDSLATFLRYGGMPYLRNLPEKSTWDEYLGNITDSIVYRDIVSRNSLRNNDFLERLMLFLSDNIGRLFTAKSISDYLKSQKTTGNVSMVQSYIRYIEDSFIINRCRRWDIAGKRFFEIGEKFFFEDIGIRNALTGYRPQDISGVIENVIYNHLCIGGYDVKAGVIGQGKEIDFIAEKNGEFKYIQTAQTINDSSTLEREFGNLEQIPDNYEKIVVTLNDSFPNTYRGIKVMNLREFLTM